MRFRPVALFALLGVLLGVLAPSAGAQETPSGPAVVVANAIDATTPGQAVWSLCRLVDPLPSHASLPGILGLYLGFADTLGCRRAFGYTCSLSNLT